MSEPLRVPFPPKSSGWIGEEDVRAGRQLDPPRRGTRYHVDLSDDAIAQFGARVVESAIEQLGKSIPYNHQPEIQRAVDALLFDRAWLEPIIEAEVRQCVREFVMSLWSDDERKAQRDWFDLFAAKLKEKP